MINQQESVKQIIELQCPICIQQFDYQIRYPYVVCLSQHLICITCIKQIIFKNKTENVCPMCKTPIYQGKYQKFRFFSQINQIKGKMNNYKISEQKLNKKVNQIQKQKQSTLIELNKTKTKSQNFQKQIRNQKQKFEEALKTISKLKQSEQQNKSITEKKNSQINAMKKQHSQKQQKLIQQKNKQLRILIKISNTLLALIPNKNPELSQKIQKLEEKLNNQEDQIFIKNRFNNPQKIIQKLQNLVRIKTILGISAKITMKRPMDLIKSIIKDLFQKIYLFINNKNLYVKFQIKIMFFRNYNNTFEHLFQQSEFQSQYQKLKPFLQKNDAKGEWTTEAIEVLLQKANEIENVDQLFLFGDSEANNEKNTNNKRQFLGEKYWNSNGYPKAYFQQQLNKVKGKYPIHSIYWNKQEFFKRVSLETNGNAKFCNVQNLEQPKLITDFILNNTTALILEKIRNKGLKSQLK